MKKIALTIAGIIAVLGILFFGGRYLIANAKDEVRQELYEKTPEYKMELMSGHRAEASAIYSQHSGSITNPIFNAIDKAGTGEISKETWDEMYNYYTHTHATNELKADLTNTSTSIETAVK